MLKCPFLLAFQAGYDKYEAQSATSTFHALPRGWAGPSLIALIAFDKYGQHQPLNRQAERIARDGIDLSLSTLADLIGHACVALAPMHARIERHVLDGGRLHGDDTTVPLLARGGTKTA